MLGRAPDRHLPVSSFSQSGLKKKTALEAEYPHWTVAWFIGENIVEVL
jgi:hypothetical protein